jgi:hypothetical protein
LVLLTSQRVRACLIYSYGVWRAYGSGIDWLKFIVLSRFLDAHCIIVAAKHVSRDRNK